MKYKKKERPEIKPCPFCGEKYDIMVCGFGNDHEFDCMKCGIRFVIETPSWDEAKAIWNKRV